MPVETEREEKVGRELVVSLVLHAAILGGLIASGLFFHHHSESWGSNQEASAISATMVAAIPLPPRQPTNEQNVLATEQPSPAPVQEKQAAQQPPQPTDIPIVAKTPPKVAPAPTKAVKTPQPTKVQPNQVQTGEAGGVRIQMSQVQTRSGAVSVGVTDSSFGERYAYYVRAIKQKIGEQWYTGVLDSGAHGRRVYYTFRIARDGSPGEIQVSKGSGDPTLDQSAQRAIQRIDTFGPLPDAYNGSYLEVQFYFEAP